MRLLVKIRRIIVPFNHHDAELTSKQFKVKCTRMSDGALRSKRAWKVRSDEPAYANAVSSKVDQLRRDQ